MTCPRCGANTLARLGEIICLLCGTLSEPPRAWDLVADEKLERPRDRARAPRTGIPWTRDELAFLVGNLDRLSAEEIGRQLGRTAAGVANLLHKRGVVKASPHYTPTHKAAIAARNAPAVAHLREETCPRNQRSRP